MPLDHNVVTVDNTIITMSFVAITKLNSTSLNNTWIKEVSTKSLNF